MDSTIFEKKNIIVFGGAGFIGSHLCERLLKEAKVICVDDFSNADPQNINHLLQYPDFEFIKWDTNRPFEPESFKELDKFKVKYQGVQEIYNLACPTSPKDFEKNKTATLLANSYGVINSLELAAKYRAKYLFTSSAVVYGAATAQKNVFTENDLGLFDHLSARACFDEGKRFAETCVATYVQTTGLDAKIGRVFTTYGTRMRLFEQQLIPDFIINALSGKDLVIYGDESFSTTLCYVTDMVDGLARLMATGPETKVMNLGGDTIFKMSDVAQKIIKLTNSSSKVVFEKPLLFLTPKGAPDLRAAKDSLGWMPLVRLDDGLQKVVDYVIARRESLNLSRED